MTELVTFGETTRLETTSGVCGLGRNNVAVGAARLGTDVCWLSKLPDSPLGRRIVNEEPRGSTEGLRGRIRTRTVGDLYLVPTGDERDAPTRRSRRSSRMNSPTNAVDAVVPHDGDHAPLFLRPPRDDDGAAAKGWRRNNALVRPELPVEALGSTDSASGLRVRAHRHPIRSST